jgi:hypothetical protein
MARTVVMVALALVVSYSSSADIEIGWAQSQADLPWGAIMFNLRYQALILEEEIGTSMTLEQIGVRRTEWGTGDSIWLENLEIHLALTDLDELTDTFDSNYDPGTRELVFSSASFGTTATPSGWTEVLLDSEYYYPGAGNLLVEVTYTDAVVEFQSCVWVPGALRTIWHPDPGSSTGYVLNSAPNMMLTGVLALEQSTFATIKASF